VAVEPRLGNHYSQSSHVFVSSLIPDP
jgi:hypothetical protein